tara:strand:+ start:1619 stop:2452 length:834 start_codon:yes stop_codon:yes gene_type:complete
MAGALVDLGWWKTVAGASPTPTPTGTPVPTATPTPTPTAVPAVLTTGSLFNYFDVADSNSFSGLASNILNLATTGSQYDGQWEAGSDVSYVSGSSFVEFRSAGALPQGNFVLNGGATVYPYPIPADFTYEAGFRLVLPPIEEAFDMSLMNVRSGGGVFFSGQEFVLQGVAGYSYPTTLTDQYNSGSAYIVAVTVAGTAMSVYLNGALEYSTTITSSRPSIASSGYQRYGAWANGSTNNGGRDFDWSFHRMYHGKALTAIEIENNYNYNAIGMGLPQI